MKNALLVLCLLFGFSLPAHAEGHACNFKKLIIYSFWNNVRSREISQNLKIPEDDRVIFQPAVFKKHLEDAAHEILSPCLPTGLAKFFSSDDRITVVSTPTPEMWDTNNLVVIVHMGTPYTPFLPNKEPYLSLEMATFRADLDPKSALKTSYNGLRHFSILPGKGGVETLTKKIDAALREGFKPILDLQLPSAPIAIFSRLYVPDDEFPRPVINCTSHRSECNFWENKMNSSRTRPMPAFLNGFKRIIVYFADLPSLEEQKKPDYPESLKTESFMRRVTDITREEFTPKCLVGKDIPVIATDKEIDEIFDSDSLVVFVQLKYPDGFLNKDQKAGYATLLINNYRAGIAPDAALLNLSWNITSDPYSPSLQQPNALEKHIRDQLIYSLRMSNCERATGGITF